MLSNQLFVDSVNFFFFSETTSPVGRSQKEKYGGGPGPQNVFPDFHLKLSFSWTGRAEGAVQPTVCRLRRFFILETTSPIGKTRSGEIRGPPGPPVGGIPGKVGIQGIGMTTEEIQGRDASQGHHGDAVRD